MKSRYVLRLNDGVKLNASNSNTFSYGRTKNINIACVQEKAQMEFELGKNYYENYSNSYCDNLIKEGIKRIFLVHILKYHHIMKLKRIELIISTGKFEQKLDLTNELIMYSMIPTTYSYDHELNLNNATFISNIMNLKKTEMGSNISSLYAYIYSKCQTFEIEKFMYLWMSFNGFYKFKYNKGQDAEGIRECLIQNNLGNDIFTKKQRDQQGPKVMAFLKGLSDQDFELLMTETSDLCERFKELYLTKDDNTKLDITTKGFLMMDFAYYLRCSVFHANKPIPLFAFSNDMEMVSVKIVNKLLGEFMDNHILEIFS